MALLPRIIVLIPMALAIVGFVLSALSLFAGHKEGFMEDYAIARLNVSRIGYDIISGGSDDAQEQDEDDDDDDSIFDDIKDIGSDIKDSVVDEFNDLVGDVAGNVAERIGISEWYSIHVMDACEGDYSPNSTASGASLNITNCADSEAGYRLNLTEMLDRELSVGPIDINLADLGWNDDIQDKLDILNDALLGLFILYVLGMGFSGISFLLCIVAVILPENKIVALSSIVTNTLATLALLIGSILITVAATKGVNELNDVAEHIGIQVHQGTKFLIITWVAAGVMLVATVFWITRFCIIRKHRTHRIRRSKI